MLRGLVIALMLVSSAFSIETRTLSGFNLNGEVKYKNLKNFDYTNTKAPKGGEIRKGVVGEFESFYPFIPNTLLTNGLDLLFDPLFVRSEDEPNSQYGLIAKSLQIPSDNTFVIFHLNPLAKFHDNTPISAFDVEYSFNVWMAFKHPLMSSYYRDVSEVVVIDKSTIRFNFKNSNRELPSILGDLRIFPKNFFKTFNPTTDPLKIPLGSGPYKIANFSKNEIVYERVGDYWAQNHPTRIGLFNFDRVTYRYYPSQESALKAFLMGEYDARLESRASFWQKRYEGVALQKGWIKKEEILHSLPSGMQGFFFNTSKPPFNNRLVREAFLTLFESEKYNKNLFFNQYTQTKSFFDNSEFSSVGLPLGKELEILNAYKEKLPKELFEKPYQLPNPKNTAEALRIAKDLLTRANFSLKGGSLVDSSNNASFTPTLVVLKGGEEQIATAFRDTLAKLNIKLHIKVVNAREYKEALETFNYDLIAGYIPQSLSAGNEQYALWHSKSADTKGSLNLARLHNQVVDSLTQSLVYAKDYEELLAYTHALDRVLLWEYIVIPHFYAKTYRLALWDFIEHSKITPLYGLGENSWWLNTTKLTEATKRYPKLKREPHENTQETTQKGNNAK